MSCIRCGTTKNKVDENKICDACHIENNEILVVDMTFKNGLELENCAIFREDPKTGDRGIQNKGELETKFQKLPWYSRYDGWIYFQSSMINGYCHVENIVDYKVKWVSKDDIR